MNASLGTKRQCPDCSAKFYDMGALEVVCPKCSYAFPIHLTSREAPLERSDEPNVAPKIKHYQLAKDDEIDGLGAVIELEELEDDYADLEHLEEVEDHHEDPENNINGDDADDDMFIDEIGESDLHIIDDIDDYEEREAL